MHALQDGAAPQFRCRGSRLGALINRRDLFTYLEHYPKGEFASVARTLVEHYEQQSKLEQAAREETQKRQEEAKKTAEVKRLEEERRAREAALVLERQRGA